MICKYLPRNKTLSIFSPHNLNRQKILELLDRNQLLDNGVRQKDRFSPSQPIDQEPCHFIGQQPPPLGLHGGRKWHKVGQMAEFQKERKSVRMIECEKVNERKQAIKSPRYVGIRSVHLNEKAGDSIPKKGIESVLDNAFP